MDFKEWISAKDTTVNLKQKINKLKLAVKNTEQFLLNILNKLLQNTFAEISSIDVAIDAEKIIIPSKEFQSYLKELGVKLLNDKSGYVKKCGLDGCAYLCSNKIIIKFTYDYKEFNIANNVKGNLHILPIIDAAEWAVESGNDGYMIYMIVMNELDTSAKIKKNYIMQAAEIISDICDALQEEIQNGNEGGKQLDEETVEYRLSLSYITENLNLPKKTVDALQDFVEVLQLIYKKSGMVLGADWTPGRNYGISSNNRVMPYDFGRPTRHVYRIGPESKAFSIEIKPEPIVKKGA